uniref:Uncharacterized protein n=1 Tax=Cacopsylla melanoneura TaxID=428564 RepID=A0A8D8V4P3_9HEMI
MPIQSVTGQTESSHKKYIICLCMEGLEGGVFRYSCLFPNPTRVSAYVTEPPNLCIWSVGRRKSCLGTRGHEVNSRPKQTFLKKEKSVSRGDGFAFPVLVSRPVFHTDMTCN